MVKFKSCDYLANSLRDLSELISIKHNPRFWTGGDFGLVLAVAKNVRVQARKCRRDIAKYG